MFLTFIRLLLSCSRRELSSEEQLEVNNRRIRMLPLYSKKLDKIEHDK
jgi:hypothetical protein